MNSSKRKGDRAERQVVALLNDELGVDAKRQLGAGRLEDIGDIYGVPKTTVQVCDWRDLARALREKPLEAEEQRRRAGTTFAATFVRLRGGDFRVVLTPAQWATLWREAV